MLESGSMPTILFSGAVGAAFATCATILFQWYRAKQEFRSLLIVVASEMIKAYGRCVLYDEQKKEGTVSFSSIFEFSDASTVARFASVTSESEANAISATMDLKYHFYQIARQVEKASEFAVEVSRLRVLAKAAEVSGDDEGKSKYEEEARKNHWAAQAMQGQALAFFSGKEVYEEVEGGIEILVSCAEKDRGDEISRNLRESFNKLRSKYRRNNPDKFQ